MSPSENKALLVALGNRSDPEAIEHVDELSFLAETLGYATVDRVLQNLDSPNPRTFVGKGKLEEIRHRVTSSGISTLIFDDDLSPSQLRNLERELNSEDQPFGVQIYDRTLLILDIFLHRARTAQARTQVELARLQYLLPRLTRMWAHLERQRGGTGTRGGAGEKEIETDRRNIRYQISVLKGKLAKIDRQRTTQRKGRAQIVRVAIAGYTNAGKSTLMNRLSGSEVMAEDKLFATVDSKVRKVVLGNVPFLLTDTVGFIRKLPHHLVESFKSTLDEIREADILLHVVDVTHPAHLSHMEVVTQMLASLGVGDRPTILVLNKADLLHERDTGSMKGFYRERGASAISFASALEGRGIEELKHLVYEEVLRKHTAIYPNYLRDGYHFAPWPTTDAKLETQDSKPE